MAVATDSTKTGVLRAGASQSIDASTHDAVLTGPENAAELIVFSGALSSNKTFQLATGTRRQTVENATTGNYTLSVKRGSAGVAFPIPQGETLEIR